MVSRDEVEEAFAHVQDVWGARAALLEEATHYLPGDTHSSRPGRRGVELDDRHPLHQFRLARVLARQDRVPEAIAELQRSINLAPGGMAWRTELGELEARLGADRNRQP